MRRLPVYLLLDISGSMRGKPINAINQGVKTLVDSLRTDPFALETVFLSLISFNNVVEQVIPLTEIYKFQAPCLEAKLGTYVGKALKFLSQTAENEVVKTTTEVKGDWKPITFIMTDGRSGDKIEKALKEFNKKLFGCIVVCAVGQEAKIEELRLITDNVIRLEEMTEESIGAYFNWVTASISQTSTVLEMRSEEVSTIKELPPLPTWLTIPT